MLGAGVHLVFHAWAAAPIVEEGRVAGAVFESKEGRLAIRAKVTIDCTGDGDLFYRAGAGSERDIDERDIHHCTNTAQPDCERLNQIGAADNPDEPIILNDRDEIGPLSLEQSLKAVCPRTLSWRRTSSLRRRSRRRDAARFAPDFRWSKPNSNPRSHYPEHASWLRGTLLSRMHKTQSPSAPGSLGFFTEPGAAHLVPIGFAYDRRIRHRQASSIARHDTTVLNLAMINPGAADQVPRRRFRPLA